MSNRYFRCGSGLDQCPHSQSCKAIAVSEDDHLIWTCPHSIHCKSNLIELSWRQAHPLAFGVVVTTAIVILLAALSWTFWPDLLLRECKSYHQTASSFAKEVDRLVDDSKDQKWSRAEWAAKIDQVAPLEGIQDATAPAELETMGKALESAKNEMYAAAESSNHRDQIDTTKGTNLVDAGNALIAKATKRHHQKGVAEVAAGLNEVNSALERVGTINRPRVIEGLPELGMAFGERGSAITSRISELEAKKTRADQKLLAIRKAPIVMRVSSTRGIADSLLAPLTRSFLRSSYAKTAEVYADGSIRRVYWTDDDGGIKQVEIVEQDDGPGFESLGQAEPDKRSDIHVAFRSPTGMEASTLTKIGNLLTSDCAQVIALDAVGILVNAGNPVTKLAENQLDDIVSGKVVNWNGVGGQDQPVSLVFPQATGRESVVVASFKKRLQGSESKQIERLVDDSMGQDPGGLGLAAFSTRIRSKMLAIQAAERTRVLMPSSFTIATEDYKYTVRIIAHHGAKASKATAEFMRFAISTEGQKAVGSSGYVDLNVKVNSEENDEVIAAIAKKVSPKRLRDAERLSTNLRFETGKADLDIKAQADIRRVVQRLAESDLQDRRLAVLGFADARGGDVVNLPLSEQRAATVADIFISQGVKPSALMGFGARMPVDTNDTDEGMQRNRRVELWILRFQEGN
jgi:phosphate transport system substrate-binding protein